MPSDPQAGPEDAVSWHPYLEAYCATCRRMVKGRRMDNGTVIPGVHYRYAGSYEVDAFSPRAKYVTQCAGVREARDIRHGMEDPRAAFSDPWISTVSHDAVKVAPTVTSGSTPSGRLWWNLRGQ